MVYHFICKMFITLFYCYSWILDILFITWQLSFHTVNYCGLYSQRSSQRYHTPSFNVAPMIMTSSPECQTTNHIGGRLLAVRLFSKICRVLIPAHTLAKQRGLYKRDFSRWAREYFKREIERKTDCKQST